MVGCSLPSVFQCSSTSLPVKNTFIDFGPSVPELYRTRTCPPSLCRLRSDPGPGAGLAEREQQTVACHQDMDLDQASTCDGSSAQSEDEFVSGRICLTSAGAGVDRTSSCGLAAQLSRQPARSRSGHDMDADVTNALELQAHAGQEPARTSSVDMAGATLSIASLQQSEEMAPPQPAAVDSGACLARKATKAKATPAFRGRIFVGVEEDDEFHTVKRLIGPAGVNTKSIVKQSGGAKISIRGRGSVFRDVPRQDVGGESAEGPLTVYVNASNPKTFELAGELVMELVRRLQQEYVEFCAAASKLAVVEQPRLEVLWAVQSNEGAETDCRVFK